MEIVGLLSYAPRINDWQWTIQMDSKMLIVDPLDAWIDVNPPILVKCESGLTKLLIVIWGGMTSIAFAPPHMINTKTALATWSRFLAPCPTFFL